MINVFTRIACREVQSHIEFYIPFGRIADLLEHFLGIGIERFNSSLMKYRDLAEFF